MKAPFVEGNLMNLDYNQPFHYAMVILSLLILVLHGFVFRLFHIRRVLLQTVTNQVILSLAVADMLTGVISFLYTLPYFEYYYCRTVHSFSIYYLVPLSMLTIWLCYVYTVHVCFFAVERYASFFSSVLYNYITRNEKIKQLMGGIWVGSALLVVPKLIWVRRYSHQHQSIENGYAPTNAEIAYSSIITTSLCFLPALFAGILYFKLFLGSKSIVHYASTSAISASLRRRKEGRNILTFVLLYSCFLILALPFFVLCFINEVSKSKRKQIRSQIRVLEAFYLMRTLTAFLNPLIYLLMKRDLRRNFILLMRSRPKARSSRDESGGCPHCSMRRNGMEERPRSTIILP